MKTNAQITRPFPSSPCDGAPPGDGLTAKQFTRKQSAPVRILHLDDDPLDAALIKAFLDGNKPPFTASIHAVHTKNAYLAALKLGGFDLILSDHRMPGYDGDAALNDAKRMWPQIPFIVVTGALGEEQAVGKLKHGAADYVLKDSLVRLVPSIERALQEAAVNRELREKATLLARQNAEIARSRHELEAVVGGMTEGLMMVDIHGQVLRINAVGLNLLGFPVDAEQPRTFSEFADFFAYSYPDGTQMPRDEWPTPRTLRGEPVGDYIARVRRLDTGMEKTLRYNGSIIHGDAGEPMLAVLTYADVTEQVRVQELLGENERRFRILADSVPFMIWATAPEGVLTMVNKAFVDFFGVTEGQVCVPGGWQEIVHPDDWKVFSEAYNGAVAGRAPLVVDARMRQKSGKWRWMHSEAAPRFSTSGEFQGMVGGGHDVTNERLMEDALILSGENLKVMVAHASEPMVIVDHEGAIEESNSAAQALLGYRHDELQGKDVQKLITPISRIEVELRLRDMRQSLGRRAVACFRVRTKDGLLEWLSVEGSITSLPGLPEKYLLKMERLQISS